MPHDIPFALARVDAINAYAKLEGWLSGIMRELIKCDPDTGILIFFTISNTRARYSLISTLAKRRHEGQYHNAWKIIEKWLGSVDQRRNKIVHWVEEFTVDHPDYELIPKDQLRYAMPTDVTLLRDTKSHFRFEHKDRALRIEDLVAFTQEVRTICEILERMFRALMLHEHKPWWNIFPEAKGHQSPEEFLQFLNGRERPTPPPPSPE